MEKSGVDTARWRALEAEYARSLAEQQRLRENAERAERSSALLADASRALSGSFGDYQATLDTVARIALPHLADWCVVRVTRDDGWVGTPAIAHVDPAKEMRARAAIGESLPAVRAIAGAPPIVAGGAPVVVNWAPEAPERALDQLRQWPTPSARAEQVMRSLGCASFMAVPLAARGRVFGAMIFVTGAPERAFGAEQIALGEALAAHAAIAVDNARLYREAQEAIRTRDEFLAVAAHELRTPCTSIALGLGGLARRAEAGTLASLPTESLGRVIAICARQGAKLSHLVDRLIDVASVRAGGLRLYREEIDLAGLVRHVAAKYRDEAASARSPLAVTGAEAVVGRWDRARVEQALGVVLDNALKYGAGSPVDVRVEAEGALARVLVTDRGIGIEGTLQPRIFLRFERAAPLENYGGLGLGLYLARELLEAHGGAIRVDSAPGRGSTFVLELPRAP